MGLSTDPVIARNLFYSLRVQQIITIWKNVFQNEKDRIQLIVSSFKLMPVISTRILAYNNLYKSHSRIMLAITGYIECASPGAAKVAITSLDDLFPGCSKDLPKMKSLIAQHASIAKQYGVDIGMYESGSSLMEYQAIVTGKTTPGATEKYIAWNKDSRFYNVYLDYYRMFDSFNMSENSHFANIGAYSKYGPWLLLEYQNQPISEAHRYLAYMAMINETRANFTVYKDPYCYNLFYNDSLACNGNGHCQDNNLCVCDEGFYGNDCVPFNSDSDLFANVDSRIVFILFQINDSYSQMQVATLASNRLLWGPIIDQNLNSSLVDCTAKSMYYDYLVDQLVLNKDLIWVTFNRLSQTLNCKEDCNFDQLLSVSNTSFSNNITKFITQSLTYMNSVASSQCQSIYGSLFTNISSAQVIQNIAFISMLTPAQLISFSSTDSLNIVNALSANRMSLTPSMAQSLADNLPANTPLDQCASIASQMSLTSFNVTSASTLVTLLPSMDLNNMNDFKKSFLVTKILNSNDKTLIQNMLLNSTDSTIINSITSNMITQLNLNISIIPATNLPQSFVNLYFKKFNIIITKIFKN